MERLVDFPRIREAPGDILERLRSIDPRADLLWWGPRLADVEEAPGRTVSVVVPVWMLGTVRQNGVRRRVGAHLLDSQDKLGAKGDRDTWRYAKLIWQGFAPVSFYPFRDANLAAIVEDFRRRDWLQHHELPAQERRFFDEAEGIPQLEMQQQKAREYAEAEGPSIWRFAFRRPKSVMVN